jgi:predicted short-subunit dehydrogenase-like oxidoreductase (DUF2520 family)
MFMKIGIVGTGKVGTTLGIALERTGHAVMSAPSRDIDLVQKLADQAEVLFLTVSDDAVADVAARIRPQPGAGVVHCSGSLALDALATLPRGVRTASFHPLQMFADVQSALESLPGTTVFLEGDDTLVNELETLALQIKTVPVRLRVSNRALYHAAGNYAGPFVIALLREAAKLWSHLGLTEEQTIRALAPLIRGTLAGVEKTGLAQGMGGPVARGDSRTIERHLEAFRTNAPDQISLYRTLCERTIPLALERGTLQPEAAQRIKHLLEFGPLP